MKNAVYEGRRFQGRPRNGYEYTVREAVDQLLVIQKSGQKRGQEEEACKGMDWIWTVTAYLLTD